MPAGIRKWYEKSSDQRRLARWEKAGRPVPPPHIVKQMTIHSYREQYGIQVLVETGTFLGDMIEAQRQFFKKIYSIELGVELWKKAVKRFDRFNHITILQGDSGAVLRQVVPQLTESAIFFLDGHYSAGETAKGDKECPIYEELNAIFESKLGHILLIDDARCFIGEGDYPTISDLSSFILKHRPEAKIETKDDTIRVVYV